MGEPCPALGGEVGEDPGDHFNLIFPVYLKLMTGIPSFHQEDVGAEILH
jgi:hypothetical protein